MFLVLVGFVLCVWLLPAFVMHHVFKKSGRPTQLTLIPGWRGFALAQIIQRPRAWGIIYLIWPVVHFDPFLFPWAKIMVAVALLADAYRIGRCFQIPKLCIHAMTTAAMLWSLLEFYQLPRDLNFGIWNFNTIPFYLVFYAAIAFAGFSSFQYQTESLPASKSSPSPDRQELPFEQQKNHGHEQTDEAQ